MAAKPVAFASIWQIQIALGGSVSSNGDIKIANSDGVSFRNNAGFPVNIVFTGVYGPINNLANGASASPNGGPGLNTTINYIIYNANSGQKTGGPYAIEFGQGPLVVTINALNTSPDPIVIPAGGQIQFQTDAQYNITWTMGGQPANVWNPQPSRLGQGASQVQTALAGANGKALSYTITNAALTRGGGTVQVGT